MKKIFIITALLILELPLFPGEVTSSRMHVIAEIEDLMVEDPPRELDINDDGVMDLMFFGAHSGEFSRYPSPEALGIFSLKCWMPNRNYRFIIAVNGADYEVMWRFDSGGLIEHTVIDETRSLLFTGSQDNRIHALDLKSGKEIWSRDMGGNIIALTVIEDNVIAMSADDLIMGMKAAGGKELWKHEMEFGAYYKVSDILVAVKDKVFAADDSGKIPVIEPKSGEIIYTIECGGYPFLKLYEDGTLYVCRKKGVVAYETNRGKELWELKLKDPASFENTVSRRSDLFLRLYKGDYSRKLVRVDRENGTVKWEYDVPLIYPKQKDLITKPEESGLFAKMPMIFDENADLLYICDRRSVAALDIENGKPRWVVKKKHIEDILFQGGSLFVSTTRKHITRIDPETGKEIWTQKSSVAVSDMVLVGDTLFFSGYEGDIQGFDVETGLLVAGKVTDYPVKLLNWKDGRSFLCAEGKTYIIKAAEPDERNEGAESGDDGAGESGKNDKNRQGEEQEGKP